MSIENSTSANKRIAKNTVFLYVRMIFVLLVSLYTTRVVLNALGVVDFGIYNVVAGFVSMFAFLNVSMTSGIQRFFNYTIGKEGYSALPKVFNTSLQIQILIAIIIFLLLETIGLWYVIHKMVIPQDRITATLFIYQFSVFSLLLVVIQVPFSAAVVAHEKMGFFAFVSVFDAIAKLVIAILLPYIGSDKLLVYGIYYLVITITNFIIYLFYCKRHFNEVVVRRMYDGELFLSILSFSGWNILGTFAFVFRAQGLTLLLNSFFGTTINAAQGIANQIQSAIQGFSGNFVVAFRPQMVQAYASCDYKRTQSLFYSLSKVSYTMLFMISIPVMFEINYVLGLWLGATIPYYSANFTILVLLNMILSSLHTPITTIIHASGQMKWFQIVTSVIVCSIIPISWFFLKMGFKPASVYWVSLVLLAINQVACLYVLHGVFPFRYKDYLLQVVYPCFLITLIVPLPFFILKNFFEPSFLRLVISCVNSVIFTGSVFFFVINEEERKVFCKMFDILKHKLIKQKC